MYQLEALGRSDIETRLVLLQCEAVVQLTQVHKALHGIALFLNSSAGRSHVSSDLISQNLMQCGTEGGIAQYVYVEVNIQIVSNFT